MKKLVILLIFSFLLCGCVPKQKNLVTYNYKEAYALFQYNNMLFIDVVLNGIPAKLLLDTGASKSLLDVSKSKKYKFNYILLVKEQYIGLGGLKDIYIVYDYNIDEFFTPFLGTDLSEITNYFSEKNIEIAGILGADFLDTHNVVIDFKKNLMYKKR